MDHLNSTFKDESLSQIKLSVLMQVSFVMALVVLSNYVMVDEELDTIISQVEETKIVHFFNPFADVEIRAQSAYVLDMQTGKVIYSKNPTEVRPLASITKVVTAITAHELADQDTTIRLSERDLETEGDSGLLVGESWRLSDLLDFTLVTSSNDGAQSIASVAGGLLQGTSTDTGAENFVREMNKFTKSIGMKNSIFYNSSGLDIDEVQSGSYGTAEDVATVVAYVLKNNPDILGATTQNDATYYSLENLAHRATNTNENVVGVPGILASKTGYTDLSGGNLVIAFDPFPGRPIVVVVLGSTFKGRFEDVQKLSEKAIEYIRIQPQI